MSAQVTTPKSGVLTWSPFSRPRIGSHARGPEPVASVDLMVLPKQNLFPVSAMGGGCFGVSSTVQGPRLLAHGKCSQIVPVVSIGSLECGSLRCPDCLSMYSLAGVPRISRVDGNRFGNSGTKKRWKSHVRIGPTELVGSANGTPVTASPPRFSIASTKTPGT